MLLSHLGYRLTVVASDILFAFMARLKGWGQRSELSALILVLLNKATKAYLGVPQDPIFVSLVNTGFHTVLSCREFGGSGQGKGVRNS